MTKVCLTIRAFLTKENLKIFFILNIATLLTAAGIYFFKYPNNFSTGGTDIIAMIVKKYSSINIAGALLAADSLIAFSTFFAFGPKTGLFSVFGLGIKSIMINGIMESMYLNKSFTIITDTPQPILDFIKMDLHRGATFYYAQGMFRYEDKMVIMTALSRRQGIRLQKVIKAVDPHAFVVINNTSEIIGKGFRGGL